MKENIRLGPHFEICFSVRNLHESIDYYLNLGFKIYTGGKDKGWCTVTDGIIYLTMFPDNFIEKEFGVSLLFNYRGGNIQKIVTFLKNRGIKLSKERILEKATGEAIFTDINRHVFYFDTSPEEERIDTP